MKLTVLVDNNTYIDHYFHGEPALSFFIEDEDEKILFDTGYSDCFMTNAKKLGIDLSLTNKIVLSHGHNDHTGGLAYIDSIFTKNKPLIITHPDTFLSKRAEEGDIGASKLFNHINKKYSIQLSKESVELSSNLLYLGEIPELIDFEPRKQVGETKKNEQFEPDFVLDDSALVYKGKEGIYIITGCSHSGICTICEYAKKVTGSETIVSILGGFHLFETDQQLTNTIDYLKKQQIKQLYPCHCVSFAAKSAIHNQLPIKEVGVGLQLEWT